MIMKQIILALPSILRLQMAITLMTTQTMKSLTWALESGSNTMRSLTSDASLFMKLMMVLD